MHIILIKTCRTVEDFDDWTSWLMYKGGVGVKGDNSWESWWDEEQVCSVYIAGFNYYALSLSLSLFSTFLSGKDES